MHNHQETSERAALGFWIYLMTDLIMFAVLFATYAVLRNNTFGGPNALELFSLPFVFVETLILLTSSFTIGLATLALHRKDKNQIMLWLTVTSVLGLAFLSMEIYEFRNLIAEGASWQTSAFLSSFFTLVGTHGLHIAVGILWILISIAIVHRTGLTPAMSSRLARLSVYWHFLDLVWIFIFTSVYLMGAM